MLKPTILSLLILSTALATQAQASQRYGAIAISRSGDWGVATNYLLVSDAEREALRSCGDINCSIRVLFRGCGAVAEHNRSVAWGVASTLTRARVQALSALEDRGKILAKVTVDKKVMAESLSVPTGRFASSEKQLAVNLHK